jgi:hypothetical protein
MRPQERRDERVRIVVAQIHNEVCRRGFDAAKGARLSAGHGPAHGRAR